MRRGRIPHTGHWLLQCILPGEPDDLSPDDWERRIDAIGEAAAKLGVEFSQAHLPYADLESHRFTQNIPEDLRPMAGKFSYAMGEYCLSLAK